jgi:hypothetical protein
MSDQIITSPPFDTSAIDELLLEANIALGRIPGPEVEQAKLQQEQKIQQEQELKAAYQAEIDAENKINAPGGQESV